MTTKTKKQVASSPKPVEHNIVNTFGKENVSAPKAATVIGLDSPGMFTPDVDPDYVFRKGLLTVIMGWCLIGEGEGMFLSGPSGSGKSSLVRQIAAKLNVNLQHMVGHGRLEFPEMVTTMAIINGNTVPQYGPLARAMKFGHWFLYDEADLAEPSTNAALNEVLQGKPLIIPETGELIKPHPMFKFFATGNSRGGRDDTGLYQGVVEQNMAFAERFWHLDVGYPSPKIELNILEKAVPNMPKVILEKMIEVATMVRAAFMGESDQGQACEVTFSTRTLRRWAKAMDYFKPMASKKLDPHSFALDMVLCNRATPETAAYVQGLVQRVFGGTR